MLRNSYARSLNNLKYNYRTLVDDRNHARLLTLAAQLHCFRRTHHRWPDTLSELKADVMVSNSDLIDAYTGRPFRYTLTKTGFEIRVLGPNLELDDPQFRAENDDQVWGWPPPGPDDL